LDPALLGGLLTKALPGMHLLFLFIVAPLFFFLLTWVVATVYRLYFPEQPLPLRARAVQVRRRRASAGEDVPVGVREIREDQRSEDEPVPYRYAGFPTGRLPEDWARDLHERRN
jgi:hypothetical protein